MLCEAGLPIYIIGGVLRTSLGSTGQEVASSVDHWQSSEHYVFVINNGTKATFNLQFNMPPTGVVPYLFVAWTGST